MVNFGDIRGTNQNVICVILQVFFERMEFGTIFFTYRLSLRCREKSWGVFMRYFDEIVSKLHDVKLL